MLETIKLLEARLEEAMAEVDELMSEMSVDQDLDKQEVFTFIRNLQVSGMGNMAIEYIHRRSCLWCDIQIGSIFNIINPPVWKI